MEEFQIVCKYWNKTIHEFPQFYYKSLLYQRFGNIHLASKDEWDEYYKMRCQKRNWRHHVALDGVANIKMQDFIHYYVNANINIYSGKHFFEINSLQRIDGVGFVPHTVLFPENENENLEIEGLWYFDRRGYKIGTNYPSQLFEVQRTPIDRKKLVEDCHWFNYTFAPDMVPILSEDKTPLFFVGCCLDLDVCDKVKCYLKEERKEWRKDYGYRDDFYQQVFNKKELKYPIEGYEFLDSSTFEGVWKNYEIANALRPADDYAEKDRTFVLGSMSGERKSVVVDMENVVPKMDTLVEKYTAFDFHKIVNNMKENKTLSNSVEGKESNADGERVSISVKPSGQGYRQRIREADGNLLNLEDYVQHKQHEEEVKQQEKLNQKFKEKLSEMIDGQHVDNDDPNVAQETKETNPLYQIQQEYKLQFPVLKKSTDPIFHYDTEKTKHNFGDLPEFLTNPNPNPTQSIDIPINNKPKEKKEKKLAGKFDFANSTSPITNSNNNVNSQPSYFSSSIPVFSVSPVISVSPLNTPPTTATTSSLPTVGGSFSFFPSVSTTTTTTSINNNNEHKTVKSNTPIVPTFSFTSVSCPTAVVNNPGHLKRGKSNNEPVLPLVFPTITIPTTTTPTTPITTSTESTTNDSKSNTNSSFNFNFSFTSISSQTQSTSTTTTTSSTSTTTLPSNPPLKFDFSSISVDKKSS